MQVGIVDYQAETAAEDFVQALRETGFAILRNHPLDSARLARMYSDWLAFFLSDEKYHYPVEDRDKKANGEGYTPPDISETAVGHRVKDIKEFYHIFTGEHLPENLRADCRDHMAAAFTLGQTLLGWVQQELPAAITDQFSAPLQTILSTDESLMRVLHYPPVTGTEQHGAERAAAHEDINAITLLPVAQQPGLQVKDQQGQWYDVRGNRGDLIINAGDMLQEMTGGFLPSTTHRVVNPSGTDANVSRISIPYFLTPHLDTPLSGRYTAGSYLNERLVAINR
jgi:isopenicillin N synthase-like dioxygenase